MLQNLFQRINRISGRADTYMSFDSWTVRGDEQELKFARANSGGMNADKVVFHADGGKVGFGADGVMRAEDVGFQPKVVETKENRCFKNVRKFALMAEEFGTVIAADKNLCAALGRDGVHVFDLDDERCGQFVSVENCHSSMNIVMRDGVLFLSDCFRSRYSGLVNMYQMNKFGIFEYKYNILGSPGEEYGYSVDYCGQELAIGAPGGRFVDIYRGEVREQRIEARFARFGKTVRYSKDRRHLAIGNENGVSIYVRDIVTKQWRPTRAFSDREDGGYAETLEFSADGLLFVAMISMKKAYVDVFDLNLAYQYMLCNNNENFGLFGRSIVEYEGATFVGAPGDDSRSLGGGSIFVFNRDKLIQVLNSPNNEIAQLYGYSLAAYGGGILASAPYDGNGAIYWAAPAELGMDELETQSLVPAEMQDIGDMSIAVDTVLCRDESEDGSEDEQYPATAVSSLIDQVQKMDI
jgi:hypothetical protein